MLTKDEIELSRLLGDCFNRWCALPGHHPMDRTEFASGIHRLQNMVMARSAARQHPHEFPSVLLQDGGGREARKEGEVMNVQFIGLPDEGILWEGELPFVPREGETVAIDNAHVARYVRHVGYSLNPPTAHVRLDR